MVRTFALPVLASALSIVHLFVFPFRKCDSFRRRMAPWPNRWTVRSRQQPAVHGPQDGVGWYVASCCGRRAELGNDARVWWDAPCHIERSLQDSNLQPSVP